VIYGCRFQGWSCRFEVKGYRFKGREPRLFIFIVISEFIGLPVCFGNRWSISSCIYSLMLWRFLYLWETMEDVFLEDVLKPMDAAHLTYDHLLRERSC